MGSPFRILPRGGPEVPHCQEGFERESAQVNGRRGGLGRRQNASAEEARPQCPHTQGYTPVVHKEGWMQGSQICCFR